VGASPSATSRRPPGETSSQGMPGTPAISPKRAAKLKAKKHREAERLFLAEGAAVLEEAPSPPLQVFDSVEQLRRVSTLQTPTGPVGVFPFLDVTTTELLASVRRVVLLHGVQDPGNVGTAIRSAHAFGAGVALSRGSADLYNPKTVRATMGSIFHVPVAREIESVDFLAEAGSAGFGLAAAVPEEGGTPESLPRGRLVVCIGSEGSGLPEAVIRACEMEVGIPSLAPSLNAAVAASILLYEAYSRVLP
jgi:RNA methyltransferase, TrmH family